MVGAVAVVVVVVVVVAAAAVVVVAAAVAEHTAVLTGPSESGSTAGPVGSFVPNPLQTVGLMWGRCWW